MIKMFLSLTLKILMAHQFFYSSPSFGSFLMSETFSVHRHDGSKIVFYLQLPERTASQKVPLLLILQGSQPESVFDHSILKHDIPSRYFTGLLMVEKPGVTRGSQDCSLEYLNRNNLNARLDDLVIVLNHLRKESWWNGELLLLGGSEGGSLAVKVTNIISIKKTILVVTGGGMTMEEALPVVIQQSMHGAPENDVQKVMLELQQKLEEIKQNPESTELSFGACNTYKYWNFVLWFRPMDLMLQTNTKYLLIHGDRDASHPVTSARMTFNKFNIVAPDRLDYWEIPDLDHSLIDSFGNSHMVEIIDLALE